MEITEVKVFPVSEEKLKAFVSIVLDGCFMVNDIKVIRGKDGLFISMPSRKKKNGEFKDVAHPLNNETRQLIEDSVLDEYERILRERGQELEVGRRRLSVEMEESDELGRPPVHPGTAPGAAGLDEQAHSSARVDGEPAAGDEAADRGSAGEAQEKEKSLEEVQEMHLRDSFWSVS